MTKNQFRPRLLILLCFALLSLAFIPSKNASLMEEVLKETNAFRNAEGLQSLQMNAAINKIAQQHSEDMANGKLPFGHQGFDTRFKLIMQMNPSTLSAAENVASGILNAKQVVELWKNSSGHRKNLAGKFKLIGIGIAKSSSGVLYFTQLFAG